MAVHHRAARAQPHLVRRRHDVDPLGGGQLALGQQPAHVVVEDLGGGAGDRAEPRLLELGEPLAHRQPRAGGRVDDLHRAEGVHVQVGAPGLDGADDLDVDRARQVGVDPALEADLGRPEGPRLGGAGGDLLDAERVGVGVGLALGERAEAAAGVADVGEVDVPVDHVGDVVADGVAAQPVGEGAQRVERRPVGVQQREGVRVGQPRRVALRGAQRRGDVGVDPDRGAGAGRFPGNGVPVTVDGVEVGPAVAGAPLTVDGRVQVGAAARTRRPPAPARVARRPGRPRRRDRPGRRAPRRAAPPAGRATARARRRTAGRP